MFYYKNRKCDSETISFKFQICETRVRSDVHVSRHPFLFPTKLCLCDCNRLNPSPQQRLSSYVKIHFGQNMFNNSIKKLKHLKAIFPHYRLLIYCYLDKGLLLKSATWRLLQNFIFSGMSPMSEKKTSKFE